MPEIRIIIPENMERALDSLIRAGIAGNKAEIVRSAISQYLSSVPTILSKDYDLQSVFAFPLYHNRCNLFSGKYMKPPPDISREAWQIHEHSVVIDLHADTLFLVFMFGYRMGARHRNPFPRSPFIYHVDIPRLREGGITAIGLTAPVIPFNILRPGDTVLRAIKKVGKWADTMRGQLVMARQRHEADHLDEHLLLDSPTKLDAKFEFQSFAVELSYRTKDCSSHLL